MTSRGFTLVDLMIAMAIIGILAAIEYPSYSEYTKKTRRAEAAAALLEGAQVAERQFSQTGAYANAPVPAHSPSTGNAVYDIALVTDAGDPLVQGGYAITATAVAGGMMDGDDCDAMSINGLGERLPNDEKCWRR